MHLRYLCDLLFTSAEMIGYCRSFKTQTPTVNFLWKSFYLSQKTTNLIKSKLSSTQVHFKVYSNQSLKTIWRAQKVSWCKIYSVNLKKANSLQNNTILWSVSYLQNSTLIKWNNCVTMLSNNWFNHILYIRKRPVSIRNSKQS